jgi:hypothetical protein
MNRRQAMKVLNDFSCSKGHIEEYFVESSVSTVPCRHCGNDAVKLLVAPRISLEGISGSFPTASDAWVRRRESHIAWERKTGRSDEWK